MSAYYNEFDPYASAWLRNLIAAGHIAEGDVDERSIADVRPADLVGYTQCHFFAGIGGWSYALRLAGWPDDRPVWTGSCPCQPFSSAGKGAAGADERHLWPHWFRLIRECRPERIFGEQVAAAVGHGWLDLVSTDVESKGYTVGAAVLGAHSVGAPHIRQRLWFVADADISGQRSSRRTVCDERHDVGGSGAAGVLGYTDDAGPQGRRPAELPARSDQRAPWAPDSLVWIPCRDGKARPTEPGLQPLAHGVSGRVGRLRAYGNAIVPQVAAEFIGAYLDTVTV